MRLLLPITLVLTATLIAGCGSTPTGSAPTPPASAARPAAPAASAPNPATKAAQTKSNLALEKLRLSELFRGTPVLFNLQPDGNMRVEVPLQYSFDAGKAQVKAPLAAVLDHVANGQLNELTRLAIAAPADAGVKTSALIGERGAGVREHLLRRGLAPTRVTVVAAPASSAVVRIVVSDAPAP